MLMHCEAALVTQPRAPLKLQGELPISPPMVAVAAKAMAQAAAAVGEAMGGCPRPPTSQAQAPAQRSERRGLCVDASGREARYMGGKRQMTRIRMNRTQKVTVTLRLPRRIQRHQALLHMTQGAARQTFHLCQRMRRYQLHLPRSL